MVVVCLGAYSIHPICMFPILNGFPIAFITSSHASLPISRLHSTKSVCIATIIPPHPFHLRMVAVSSITIFKDQGKHEKNDGHQPSITTSRTKEKHKNNEDTNLPFRSHNDLITIWLNATVSFSSRSSCFPRNHSGCFKDDCWSLRSSASFTHLSSSAGAAPAIRTPKRRASSCSSNAARVLLRCKHRFSYAVFFFDFRCE